MLAMPGSSPERAETQCIVSHSAAPAQVSAEKTSTCIAITSSGWTARPTQPRELHTLAACAAMYPKGYGTDGIEICHGDNPGSGTEFVIQYPLSVVPGDNVSSLMKAR